MMCGSEQRKIPRHRERERVREKERKRGTSHARVVVYINCAAATTVGMWACM